MTWILSKTGTDGADVSEGAKAPPRPKLRLVEELETLDDQELMFRYQDGELAAFDLLVHRHRARLFRFLNQMIHPRAKAEELVGEVFLKIHLAAPRYEASARFTTWMFTIAYRLALNTQQRDRRRPELSVGGDKELNERAGGPGAFSSPAADPERHLALQRAAQAIDTALAKLQPTHRAAVLLYYVNGLNCAECGQALGEDASTIKGRLAYARKLLRQELGDQVHSLPDPN